MIIISLLIYCLTFMRLIKCKEPLLIFLFLIYTIQFYPLFTFSDYVVFWPSDQYSFERGSSIIETLNIVFIFSNLGFLCFSFFMPVNKIDQYEMKEFNPINKIPNFINWILILFTLLFIGLYSLISDSGVRFNGVDLIITALISVTISNAFLKNNRQQLYSILIVFSVYIVIQVLNADRNFFGVLLMLLIAYFSFCNFKYKKGFVLLCLGAVLVLIASYMALIRNGVELNVSTLVLYVYYNSWTAVIRPFVDLLIQEQSNPEFLYGKTYLDLFLSAGPSPVYSLLEIEKPFVLDNPAFWYHVTGGGGMHAIGIAYKNFGVFGVFCQSFLFSAITVLLVRAVRFKNNFYYYIVFIVCGVTYMKSIWYSMIEILNGLALAFFIIFIVWLLRKVLPKSDNFSIVRVLR